MNTEEKCIIASRVCEGIIGYTAGVVIRETVIPKCGPLEKVIVTAGTSIAAWTAARYFGKTFFKWCDDVFDTDFGDIVDGL